MAGESQSLSVREQLLELEKKALRELEAVRDPQDLEQFRIVYLGKKGRITAMMKRLGGIPAEERPEVGQLANRIKRDVAERFEERRGNISSEKRREEPSLDLTLPGREPARGHVHPITQV